MRTSTIFGRIAPVVAFAFLTILSHNLSGQCSITPNGGVVSFTQSLSSSGTATINAGTLTPYIGWTCPGGGMLEFSSSSAFTSPMSGSFVIDCNMPLTNPVSVYVRANDGTGVPSPAVELRITVVDSQTPVITCPVSMTVSSDAGTCTRTTRWPEATDIDNCTTTITYSPASYPADLIAPLPVGLHNITATSSDASGNVSSCSFSIRINDNEPPSITCPPNVTLNANANCVANPAMMSPSTVASASDNCSAVVTYSTPLNTNYPLGSTPITATATDPAGNSKTCTFIITVRDATAPTFTVAPTITLNVDNPLSCSATTAYVITADSLKDNCSSFATLSSTIMMDIDYSASSGQPNVVNVPFDASMLTNFELGTTTVTFRATDAASNTGTITVNFVVVDRRGPVFNPPPTPASGDTIWCGRTFNLSNAANACTNTFTWRRPSAFFGDVSDCNAFTVTESVSNPVIETAINSAAYNYILFTPSTSISAQFPVGSTTVTYTATDMHGNTAVCSFQINVADVQPPSIICPANTTLATICPTSTVPDYRAGASVVDNCAPAVTVTQSPSTATQLGMITSIGTPNAGDMFPVTLTATDGTNSVNCTFTVTLSDGNAPVPTTVPLRDVTDSCGALTILAPFALDGCFPTQDTIYGVPSIVPAAGVTFIPGTRPAYRFPPGVYNVNWSYSDGSGNIATQNHVVRVLPDTFPPVAICRPLITVPLRASGDTTITAAAIDNGSFDPSNCGPITLTLSKTTFTCGDLDTNMVVLTVRDVNGRTATCNSRIVIQDVTKPTFQNVPANVTISTCDMIPTPPAVTATDACTSPVAVQFSQTSTQTASGCGRYQYIITRKWVARDARMNADSVIRTITIIDQAPIMTMIPDTITHFTSPNRTSCNDTVRLDYQSLVKECIPGVRYTLVGGSFPGLYNVSPNPHFVVIVATDSCGNNAAKTVAVIVKDGTPPNAVCINGISTTVGPGGQAVITQNQINNSSFDFCGPVTVTPVTYTFTCADADGITRHPVSITVRDVAGNTSTCSTFVVVQENVAPVVTCPPNITVQCNQSVLPSMTGTATATDNCPGALSPPTFNDLFVAGTNGTCQTITRRWTVSDGAGNTGTCMQTIVQRDTVAPVLSGVPANDTITCYRNISAMPTITTSDNCDPSVTLTMVQDTLGRAPGICGKYNYTIRRTFTGTDDCGLTTTRSYHIVVRDTERPSFPGMPDTVIINASNFPAQPNCRVNFMFDAYQYLSECADSVDLTVTNNAPLGNGRFKVSGNYNIGTYKVRFDVTDPCGNFGRDSVVFIVRDNITPTMVCETSIDIALGTNGTATIDTSVINIATSDNCGIDTMFLDKYTFNCGNLGMNAVTLTAIDNNGNSNSCTVNVNVLVGSSTVFTAQVTGTPTTYFGASTGSAAATVSGAGSYTYLWSNSATTASISGLAAGTYTVTITNTTSGCVLVDTAVVAQGPKINLTVGSVTATTGSTVLVPVTTSQLINVNSLSFALIGINPSVAVVNNLVNINPIFATNLTYTVSSNIVSVVWVDPAGGLLNLPANTVLFNIEAVAVGATNTMTPVNIGASGLLPFEFIQQFGNNQVVVPVDVINGSISISSSATNLLGGLISTWKNPDNPNSVERPVANVIVNANVPTVQPDTTDITGVYQIAVPTASNTLTRPMKRTAGNAGITSSDLLRIVQHIFGQALMSPYQQIAANVNNDTIISLGDFLRIQRLVVGTVQHIDTLPDWIFIPRSFAFPTTGNWLRVNYPTTIAHTPLLTNFTNDHFVAIRRGDVNGNAPVSLLQADDRYGSNDVLTLVADDQQSLNQGDELAVPIFADKTQTRQAMQGTFDFDSESLEFVGVEAGTMPIKSTDFGYAHTGSGYLTFAWAHAQPISIDPVNPMFTLHFRAKQHIQHLSETMVMSSEVTRAESYTDLGETTPVELRFRSTDPQVASIVLMQTKPNPATETADVSFILPEAADAQVRILDMSGRVVRTYQGSFGKGINQITVSKHELGGDGVYFCELISGKQTARRKMVFIK